MNKLNKISNRLYLACLRLARNVVKINPRIMVFMSTPDFSDNSLALTEYLLKNGYTSKYDIYWAVSRPEQFRNAANAAGIRFIHKSGWKKMLHLRTYLKASWLFTTHGFAVKYTTDHPARQHFVRLWHGCSYKDKDAFAKSKGALPGQFDKALVAGPLFTDAKKQIWNCPEEKILALGYPRYDWLRKPDKAALALYSQLRGEHKKVVIWMPTFRVDRLNVLNDTANITQFPLMPDMEAWHALDEHCRQSGVKLLVKLHPQQKDYDIDWSSLRSIGLVDNETFRKAGTTMYSFLATTDGLLTDYSSVGVDYLIVNRPIGFTLDDYELYKGGRGFVVPDPRRYMPGHHLYTTDELYGFISDVGNGADPHTAERQQMAGLLIHKSEHYCKDIADALGL